MSCLTGNFPHNTGCWSEYWIGHEKLSTTFIGASQPSSINQHAMNRGFGIALVDREITKMGLIHDFSKEYTFDSINDLAPNLAIVGATEYHLFGDPAVETMKENNTPVIVNTASVPAGLSVSNVTTKAMTVTVPARGMYTISVYSIDGRLLCRFRDSFTAGTHRLGWNGSMLGRQLSLITIKGKDKRYLEKAVLLR
jgi:hypothetical protein